MKTPLPSRLLAASALTALASVPFAGEEPCEGNIVDVAVANGSFTTLVDAVTTAGLADALQGPGPFTVFAPTDDAFAKLPPVVAEFLFANPDVLAQVLLYHVVGGEVGSDVAVTLPGAPTLLSQRLDLEFDGSTLFVDDATVVLPDVGACNGVIHVIDEVLVPDLSNAPGLARAVAAQLDVVDALVLFNFATGEFSSLLDAVVDADLVDDLKGLGSVTVFAPTDAAFAALPRPVLAALAADPGLIVDVLLYHAVSDTLFAADVIGSAGATTLLGQDVSFAFDGSNVFVNDSQVILANLRVSNGVVHAIDEVLIPAL